MKNFFLKTKHFVKNNKWWSGLIIIVVLIVIYSILKTPEENQIETVIVQKGNIIEEVSATGSVKPLSDISLGFEMGGRVANILVAIGDKVSRYQTLAYLSNADLSAALDQANASLKAAEANLELTKKGSTPEQIAISQSQQTKALNDLNNAKNSLIYAIQDAYTKSDDAIRNKTDVVFDNPRGTYPALKFALTDPQLSININLERANIENLLLSWSALSAVLNINSDLSTALNTATKNLNKIKDFLEQINLALNSAVVGSSVSQTSIDAWKIDVASARSSIGLSINNLSSAATQYESANSLLKIAENQLSLTKAGATEEEIKAKEALVDQAMANVANVKATLEKSIIRSPINGTISRIDTKIGETVPMGKNIISIISFGEYEVETFIPEADIAKIKIGDVATTTLDAYGSDVYFKTTVIKIDPAETLVDNVPTYKVTLKFESNDNRVKSGMTANLDILTNQRNNVLIIPSRTVYSKNGSKFVTLIDEKNKKKEVEIKTGLRGVSGYIEVISGLKEGDKIASSPKK